MPDNKMPLNVLLVSSKYPPEYAGSGLRAHNTYRRLASKFNVQFKVLAGSVTFSENQSYDIDGVQVQRIAQKRHYFPVDRGQGNVILNVAKRIWNRFYRWLSFWQEAIPTWRYLYHNRTSFDVIHVFGRSNVTFAAMVYAKATKTALMVELVNLLDNPQPYEPFPLALIFGRGYRPTTEIVCISDVLRQVSLHAGYADEQIWCRPNPIDEHRFDYEPDRGRYRNQIWSDLGPADHLIVYLAKFRPLKNQLFLIDVLAQLPEQYKLLLVGPLVDSGPLAQTDQAYYRSVRELIEQRHLNERVRLQPGYADRPEVYIKAADVYAISSTSEALGTPILEALACGVPVAANEMPGVFERWIEDGTNGFICPLDPEVWADKIQRAVQISPEIMRVSSEKILEVASTEVIDREYYRRLKALSGIDDIGAMESH